VSLNVVWDFGRVLLRWRPKQLLRETLPHIASDAASAAHWAGQIFQSYGGDWADFDRGTVSPGDLVQRIARRTGLSTAEVQRVVEAAPLELQPLPDSVALLQRLHAAGCGLFYLSNMPAPFAEHLERSHAELRLFRDGVFSARVHHNKPEPRDLPHRAAALRRAGAGAGVSGRSRTERDRGAGDGVAGVCVRGGGAGGGGFAGRRLIEAMAPGAAKR
jgi:putative hydrolase of the HAD superfamily